MLEPLTINEAIICVLQGAEGEALTVPEIIDYAELLGVSGTAVPSYVVALRRLLKTNPEVVRVGRSAFRWAGKVEW